MADSASEAYLRKFFQQNAADGVPTEQSHLNLALLSWAPARACPAQGSDMTAPMFPV